MERVIIHTPFIKLDALLKYAGLCETGGSAPCGAKSASPATPSRWTAGRCRSPRGSDGCA